MSTYFQAWGSVLATCPDPTAYDPEPALVTGRFPTGRPVAQGYEQGTISWANISLADWIDLHARWLSNYTGSGTFVIPPRAAGGSWSSWRSVTAWAEEPIAHYEGNIIQSASMHILITG